MSLFKSTERLFRPNRIFFTKSYTWDLVVRYIKDRNVKNRSLSWKMYATFVRATRFQKPAHNATPSFPISAPRRNVFFHLTRAIQTMAAMPLWLTLHKKGREKNKCVLLSLQFFPCPKRLRVTSLIDFAVCKVSIKLCFPWNILGIKVGKHKGLLAWRFFLTPEQEEEEE